MPYDLNLIDQYGDRVDLASFCGNDILLVLGAMWCGSCRAEAASLQTLQNTYGSSGVTVINLMVQNSAGNAPSAAELNSWATTYGLTTVPVLGVSSTGQWWPYERDMSFPSATHIAPNLVIDSLDQGADDPSAW